MQRGKMKNKFTFISIALILVTLSVVIANAEMSKESEDFVKKLGEEIKNKKITEVKKIDFNNVPEQVKIENIDETHLSMYELTSEEEPEKPLFMITFSEKYIPKQNPMTYSRTLLDFSLPNEINESDYMQMSNGITSDLDMGYIMTRKGSITGISTIADISEKDNSGVVEIIIYKNGEEVGFRNIIDASSAGIKKDFDLQSIDTINFNQGDIISVFVKVNGKIVIKNILTNLEITTD